MVADTKKGKSFDIIAGTAKTVTKPKSQPIVVSRGPIIGNQSMNILGDDSEDVPANEEGMISQAKPIVIKPLGDSDNKPEDKSISVNSNDKEEPKVEVEAQDNINSLAPPEEDIKEEAAKQEFTQTPAEAEESETKEPETETAPAENELEAETKAQDTQEEESSSSQPETTQTVQPETISTPESSGSNASATTVQPTATDAVRKKQELQKEAEDKEHIKKLDQLVSSEHYFLPINMKEKRRNQKNVILLAVICVILAAVWVDVALDAGIISNNLNLPHTHFFVSKS